MSWGRRRFTIEELRLVCKIKGYRGTTSKKRQFFQDYLTQLNVPDEEIRTLARQALTGQFGAGTTKEVVVERIVERGIKLEPDVLAAIRAEVSKAHPHKIILTSAADTKPTALKERVHPVFERALRAARAGLNVLLVGPAGSGKSYLGEQLSEVLGRGFGSSSFGPTTPTSKLFGFNDAHGNFNGTPYHRCWSEGGVFVGDELDNGHPGLVAELNQALAGTTAAFACGNVTKHPDHVFIGTANTFGRGPDRQYVGRNILDAATLDRFATVEVTYDEALETALAKAAGGSE